MTSLDQIESVMKRGFTEQKEFDTVLKCQKGRMIALTAVQLNTVLLTRSGDRYDLLFPVLVENLWRAEQLLLRMIELTNNQKRK